MNFVDADGLSGKDLAEIDFLVAQTDAAAASDHDGFVVDIEFPSAPARLKPLADIFEPGSG